MASDLLRRPAVLFAVGGLLGMPLIPQASSAGAPQKDISREINWVALGDSYSSGEGVEGAKGKCAQSTHAYSRVAQRLLASVSVPSSPRAPNENWKNSKVNFQACTGGLIEDIPKQLYLAGDKKFDLVTLTISGNNVGFSGLLMDCLGVPDNIFGGAPLLSRCKASEASLKKRVDRQRSNIRRIYSKISAEALSPDGRVVVLGYPRLFESPDHWPSRNRVVKRCAGIHRDDAKMIRRVSDYLNKTISEVVDDFSNMSFINVEKEGFEGHNLCPGRGFEEEWLNGISAGFGSDGKGPRPMQSFHPKKEGHVFEGERLAKVLGGFDWLPTLVPGRYRWGIRPDNSECPGLEDSTCRLPEWSGRLSVGQDGAVSGSGKADWNMTNACEYISADELSVSQSVKVGGRASGDRVDLALKFGKVEFVEDTLLDDQGGFCDESKRLFERAKKAIGGRFLSTRSENAVIPVAEIKDSRVNKYLTFEKTRYVLTVDPES